MLLMELDWEIYKTSTNIFATGYSSYNYMGVKRENFIILLIIHG